LENLGLRTEQLEDAWVYFTVKFEWSAIASHMILTKFSLDADHLKGFNTHAASQQEADGL